MNMNSGNTDAFHVVAAIGFVFFLSRVVSIFKELFEAAGLGDDKNNWLRRLYVFRFSVIAVGLFIGATWALPDEFVQQLISAMFVGIGFGLRDMLIGIFCGMRIKGLVNENDNIVFYCNEHRYAGQISKMSLTSFELKTSDECTDGIKTDINLVLSWTSVAHHAIHVKKP